MTDALVTFHTSTGAHAIRVEVSSSDEEIARGLMCRESLARDEGMLFLFQNRDRHAFWMKNTLIPLDIVFVDDDMRVVDVLHDCQPMSYDVLTPAAPGRFVVELAAGEARRRGIVRGTAVVFEDVVLADEHCGGSLESTRGGTLGEASYPGNGMTFDAYPVDPATAVVTSLFAAQEAGLRTSPHRGMDFGVPVGTPVKAVWDGVAESVFLDSGGGGNVIFLRHPNGLRTAYLHLSQFKVTRGQSVSAGDVIALSGGAKGAPGAGSSTGPHLHFEVRKPAVPPEKSDTRLDPLQFFPGPLQLSSSLAKQLGNPLLHPTARGIGLVGVGLLVLAGVGAYRLGKARGWF